MRLIIIILLLSAINIKAKQKKLAPTTDSLRKEILKIKSANIELASKTHFQYFIIKSENNTFGYDVYTDGNLYLHQQTIPAVKGNNGFADTTSAGRVARFAIQKIQEGEIPPTISIEDLKKMEIVIDE